MSSRSLIRLVAWARTLAGEVLAPGAVAVDLTAGGGRDTLFLWQQVAPQGLVVSFDIQPAALAETAGSLHQAGVPLHWTEPGRVPGATPGVWLVENCHSRLANFLNRPPRVVMANLGYHPGGDPYLVTRPDTTLAALQAAAHLLAAGGRLLVTVYPGHPGGAVEAAAVEGWFVDLDSRAWDVLNLRVGNRRQAPFLLVAEKRGRRNGSCI